MRSFIVYVLLKILPQPLTETATAFIFEREGISPCAPGNVTSDTKEAACAAPQTTASPAF